MCELARPRFLLCCGYGSFSLHSAVPTCSFPVAGLCNNANQLAHRANSTGVAGQESVDKMTALALEVYRLVGQQW